MSLHHGFEGPETAPVLVLSGSLGTTLELWDELVEPLSSGTACCATTIPGTGARPPARGRCWRDSRVPSSTCSRRHGLERVAFCGLSLGSAVGMWLGANAPERIERLVLACMPPVYAAVDVDQHRGAGARRDEAVTPTARWDAGSREHFREQRPDVVERFRAMIAGIDDEGYARGCEAVGTFKLRGDGAHRAAGDDRARRGDPVVSDEGRAALARISMPAGSSWTRPISALRPAARRVRRRGADRTGELNSRPIAARLVPCRSESESGRSPSSSSSRCSSFGPKRLPQMGRGLGRGMREFKDAVSGMKIDDAPAERAAVRDDPQLVPQVDQHDQRARAVDALDAVELDVGRGRRAGDEHDRRPSRAAGASAATRSGTVSTTARRGRRRRGGPGRA